MPPAKVERLRRCIETLKQKLKALAALEAQMRATGEQQISLTDPDARAMTSQSHSAYVVGYNVQSAVDTQNHIIVAHEVSNVGIDKGHLSAIAGRARDALDAETIEVLADRGYFKSEELAACEAAGIETYVPKPLTSNARAEGRFDRRDFVYERESNSYLSSRREAHLSDDHHGGWQGHASLLDEGLRGLCAETALHDKQRAAHRSVGA